MNKEHIKVHMTIIVFIILIISIPLILKIPIVKGIISYWLSFSENNEYKIAYIQLVGTCISSFIAIYGALWIHKVTTKHEAIKKQKNNISKIYYEIKTSLDIILQIFDETKHNYNLKRISQNDINKFCDVACGKNLQLSETWIVNISQLDLILRPIDIMRIYEYYKKLLSIDLAFKSCNPQKIKEIYISHICWFVSCNEKNFNQDVDRFLKMLYDVSQ